jgi:hypothetical protein
MISGELTLINALSIVGPTFTLGMISGWILAVFYSSGSSSSLNYPDDDERK